MSQTVTVGINDCAISGDGRFVAYSSRARNVVPGLYDSRNTSDVFLYDRETLTSTLVSHGDGLSPGSNSSLLVYMPADGSAVAFFSSATNLTAEAADGLFLFERLTGVVTYLGRATTPVVFSSDGERVVFISQAAEETGQAVAFERSSGMKTLLSHQEGSALPSSGYCRDPSISGEGRFTAFACSANDIVPGSLSGLKVFLNDRTTGLNSLVSPSLQADRNSYGPLLSDDGRFVAFTSNASTLVAGTVDQNGRADAFLFERVGGVLKLMSHRPLSPFASNGGTRAVAISSDGGRVLLSSSSRDLVEMEDDPQEWEDVFLHSRISDTNVLVSHVPDEPTKALGGTVDESETMSDDGLLIAFSSFEREGTSYVKTLWISEGVHGEVRSMAFDGLVPLGGVVVPRLAVSGNGRRVAFTSSFPSVGFGVRDFDGGESLYGWDAVTSVVEPLSLAGDASRAALVDPHRLAMSRNGRVVLFKATQPNAFSDPLAPPSWSGIAVLDRDSGRTDLVNWTGSRNVAASDGRPVGMSADGSTILFVASDVLVGDGLMAAETTSLFAFDRASGSISLVSRSLNPRLGAGVASEHVSVSADGRFVTFEGGSPEVAGDISGNAWTQIFLWSRDSGSLRVVSRTPRGTAGDGNSYASTISADGSTVAFVSLARDLIEPDIEGEPEAHVYVQNRVSGLTRRVTLSRPDQSGDIASGLSPYRSLSDDGRYLLFHSRRYLPGVVGRLGPFNLHRYDRDLAETLLVSHGSGNPGERALEECRDGEISRDGRRVAFRSWATNLVPGVSGGPQIFLFDPSWHEVRVLSRWIDGSLANVPCRWPRLSGDGSMVAFSGCGFASFVAPEGQQAFAYDVKAARLYLASHAGTPTVPGNDYAAWEVALDDSGDSILFMSGATNLGIGLGATDLTSYPRERRTGLFVFTPPPVVLGSTPSCASSTGGRVVSIHGGHFQPGATVSLDGVSAAVTSVSSSEIVAIAGPRTVGPAHTGNIVVTNPNGEYAALGSAFTYAVRGDANNSGSLSPADSVFLNLAIFFGGAQPVSLCNGDANGSGAITPADSLYLNLYLFLGGAAPPP